MDTFEDLEFFKQISIAILTSSKAEEDRIHTAEYGLGEQLIVKPLSKDTALLVLEFML